MKNSINNATLETGRAFPLPSAPPFKQQSIIVPGTARPGQTGHYRNAMLGLLDPNDPKYLTKLDDAFTGALKLGADRRCLGHRQMLSSNPLEYSKQYEWLTYGEVDIRRRAIGSALHKMFQSGELSGGDEYDTVGIWSINRPEWMIVELALQSYNKVNVALYESLGAGCVAYIINHAHLSVVFASIDYIAQLLDGVAQYPLLRLIISFDPLPNSDSEKSLSQRAESLGIRLMDLQALEEMGRVNPIEPIPAKPLQVSTICYTSGSTGEPKGAILTHQNLGMAIQANLYGISFGRNARFLSYMPLAHVLERVVGHAMIALGGCIGYYTGDPKRLLEDIQVLKPNFFPAVPRVLNRIYQDVMTKAKAPGIEGILMRLAISSKLQRLHATGDMKHAFWDWMVFKKIRALLGGQLELIICGAAPISKEALDVLRIVFACNFQDAYGMTENAGTCTRSWPGDPTSSGTIGPPQCVNEIKLIDVPSMNYTVEDKPYPRGELCVRGPTCIQEYYKDEKNTKEAIDEEGWIHTGDIASVDECGRFIIIDRVKNIIKLAQGEYVALEKIGVTYSACPIVSQVYVHGNPLESYLVGVVVLEPVELATVASKVLGNMVSVYNQEALQSTIQDSRVVDDIFHTLNQEAQSRGLKGFEMIRRIHLTLDRFSVEDGTLTPTFKIIRRNAYRKFKTELDGLYALGEPTKVTTPIVGSGRWTK